LADFLQQPEFVQQLQDQIVTAGDLLVGKTGVFVSEIEEANTPCLLGLGVRQ
jgi:hypothetical protein